jgi:hypothetical protein
MYRNVLPSGLLGVFAAAGDLQNFNLIKLLPLDIQPNYLQNELKPTYPDTVIMDSVFLPQSAQQAVAAGGFGALRMVAIVAGKGLNATGVTSLSTNSSLVYVPNAPHVMPFHQVFANVIIDQVRGAISYSKYVSCSAHLV